MQATTLTIAVAASLLVVLLRPAQAFAVYVGVLLFYPSFLVVRVGTLDISAGRIVGAVLLAHVLANHKLRSQYHWCALDFWVTGLVVIDFGISLIAWNQPTEAVLENRLGAAMDTFMAYFLVRLCITNRESVLTSLKWIAIMLVPLAFMGAFESYTGLQVFAKLKIYCPWYTPREVEINPRLGFYRAGGVFANAIMFGASFAMFLPLVFWLRKLEGIWHKLGYVLSLIVVVGAFSSMSSGPWMMVLIICGFLILENVKRLLIPILITFVIGCFVVGIISNRPFYHVIASYANPVGGSGWHRAKLIDCAIEDFDKWWMVGYGGKSPDWGKSLGMAWTDITSEYIMFGVKYGILGIIVLCGILGVSISLLKKAYNYADDPSLESLYWALGTVIGTLIISFNAIALFTQAFTLFYCILGYVGSSVGLAGRGQNQWVKATKGTFL